MPRRPAALNPITVSDDCWLYSEKKGLSVVIEQANGDKTCSVLCLIDWKYIDQAIAEKPKG